MWRRVILCFLSIGSIHSFAHKNPENLANAVIEARKSGSTSDYQKLVHPGCIRNTNLKKRIESSLKSKLSGQTKVSVKKLSRSDSFFKNFKFKVRPTKLITINASGKKTLEFAASKDGKWFVVPCKEFKK